MNEFVTRLCEGKHPVKASLLTDSTPEAFHKRILDNYVHIEFTDTKGGTILGIEIDKEASDLSSANFDEQCGNVHLVGSLQLNYEEVRCISDIDICSLQGEGYLERNNVEAS
jgi:hypothetical protein